MFLDYCFVQKCVFNACVALIGSKQLNGREFLMANSRPQVPM